MGRPALPVAERLISYTDRSGACWVWTAGRNIHGYGKMSVVGQQLAAHRVSYEHHVGPIPAGLQLDHLCRNRACINPDHLEPVTERENILRGVSPAAINARKTTCLRGHPFDRLTPDGRRRCRTCASNNMRAQRARKKLL